MALSDHLKKLLTQQNISYRRLGSLSGVDHSYISKICKGEVAQPSPEILKKLANALATSYHELLQQAGYLTEQTSEIDLVDLLQDPNTSFTARGKVVSWAKRLELLAYLQAEEAAPPLTSEPVADERVVFGEGAKPTCQAMQPACWIHWDNPEIKNKIIAIVKEYLDQKEK